MSKAFIDTILQNPFGLALKIAGKVMHTFFLAILPPKDIQYKAIPYLHN